LALRRSRAWFARNLSGWARDLSSRVWTKVQLLFFAGNYFGIFGEKI